MSLPAAIIREIRPETSGIGMYARLLVPVVLVTSTRGKEVFTDTRRLFARLASIEAGALQAIWQGQQHVSEAGVAALVEMLDMVGLENFDRASRAQRGGARAIGSKYQWYFLSEYLGWEWERV